MKQPSLEVDTNKATNEKTQEISSYQQTCQLNKTIASLCNPHGSVCIDGKECEEVCFDCGMEKRIFEDKSTFSIKVMKYGCFISKENKKYFLFEDQRIPVSDTVYGADNETLLHFASRRGVEWMVKRILEEGRIDVNVRNSWNKTPLMLACYGYSFTHEKYFEICKLLLKHKASVNLQDKEKHTALHYAMEMDYLPIIQLLVENGGDVNIRQDWGNTALHEAGYCSNVSVLQYILSLGRCDVNGVDIWGSTPLICAFGGAESSSLEKVKLLIQNGAKIVFDDETVWSPLHTVFGTQHKCVIDFIITRMTEEKGISRKELISWMLHPPFCTAIDCDGFNWIFRAFRWKKYNMEVLETLLNLEEEISFSTTASFGIPLHYVIYDQIKDEPVYSERKEELQVLFEKLKKKSIRVDLVDDSRKRHYNDDEILQMFVEGIENGNINDLLKVMKEISTFLTIDWLRPVVQVSYQLKHNPKYTLFLAPQVQLAMEPHIAHRKILKIRTAYEERSLLHVAAETGNEKAVHLLLLLGARNTPDTKNMLPYQYALEKGHYELADFLLVYNESIEFIGKLTERETKFIRDSISLSTGDTTFNGLKIFPDIPGRDDILSNIRKLRTRGIDGKSGEISNSMGGASMDNVSTLSKRERNDQIKKENQNLRDCVLKTIDQRFPDNEHVFTDGTHKSGYCASSYYDECTNLGTGYPILSCADINSAELVAFKIALEEITSNDDTVFLSDRQAMIPVLEKLSRVLKHNQFYINRTDTPQNVLLNWIILCRLKFPVNPYVTYGLQWVPAHIGIEGNEIADALAFKGREEERIVKMEDVKEEVMKIKEKIAKMLRTGEEG